MLARIPLFEHGFNCCVAVCNVSGRLRMYNWIRYVNSTLNYVLTVDLTDDNALGSETTRVTLTITILDGAPGIV